MIRKVCAIKKKVKLGCFWELLVCLSLENFYYISSTRNASIENTKEQKTLDSKYVKREMSKKERIIQKRSVSFVGLSAGETTGNYTSFKIFHARIVV